MDTNKVVCKCKKITYGDLKNAIENGAKSFKNVKEVTKVATDCKKCKDKVKNLVNQLLEK
ncbi:(2Fe-2S)-binding protein [Heliobacillus mobilis]|uniref:(2Fe-2S)-binding protein n=1 Tax=Heliobacterium mobile TaxID=28064 RepID=A0A6I3SNW0_HELMO|nr:(2Fe-2S)-binding protein [Heliobacterium mobile]